MNNVQDARLWYMFLRLFKLKSVRTVISDQRCCSLVANVVRYELIQADCVALLRGRKRGCVHPPLESHCDSVTDSRRPREASLRSRLASKKPFSVFVYCRDTAGSVAFCAPSQYLPNWFGPWSRLSLFRRSTSSRSRASRRLALTGSVAVTPPLSFKIAESTGRLLLEVSESGAFLFSVDSISPSKGERSLWSAE